MALPTSTGLRTGSGDGGLRSILGPFKSSAGNFYVVGRDSAANNPSVAKATDPTSSWTEQDASNVPSTGTYSESCHAVQVGDVLHILTVSGFSTPDVYYHAFSMSSDTWTTTDTLVDSPTSLVASNAAVLGIRSDGDKVAVFAGDDDNVGGTDYGRIDYAVDTGSGFGTPAALDDGGSVHYYLKAGVMDDDDNFHVGYSNNDTTLWHKRMNASDSLSSQQTLQGSLNFQSAGSAFACNFPDGATARVAFAYNVASGINDVGLRTVEDSTLGSHTTVNDAGNDMDSTGGHRQYFCAADGTRVYLIWNDGVTAGALYQDFNDGDWGWSPDTAPANNDSVDPDQFCGATVYVRGGNKRLAYLYPKSGTVYYDEIDLGPEQSVVNLIGFETGATDELTSISSGSVQSTTTDGSAYALQDPDTARYDFTAASDVVVRFKFRLSSLPGANTTLMQLANSTPTARVTLTVLTTGALRIQPSGGETRDSTTTLSTGTWYTVEIWGSSGGGSDAIGALRIDGATEAVSVEGTFTDNLSVLLFGAGATALGDHYIDSLRIDEGSDWIGDGRIEALRPNASGDETNWSGTFADIDDDPANDSTYREAPATGSTPFLDNLEPSSGFSGTVDTVNYSIVRARALYTAASSGSERMAPDTLISTTNLSGAVGDIDEDPDSGDANWLTAPGSNNNTEAYVSFGTPTASLETGADLQEIRAQVRKTNHSTDPDARIELWENGSLVSAGSDTTISSTSGTVLSYTWDATGRTAAQIEAKVIGTTGGGSPSNRASVEVGAIEWNAAVSGGGGESHYLRSKKSGGSAENSADLGLTTSVALYSYSPSTQPASTTELDSWQAGGDQSAAGGDRARITELWFMVDYSLSTGTTYNDTATVAATAGLSGSALAVWEPSSTVAASAGLSSSAATSVYEAASAVAASAGLTGASEAIWESSSTVAASAGLAAVGGKLAEESATIAASAGLSASSEALWEAAATLAATSGLTPTSEAVWEASSLIAASSGLAASVVGSIGEAITLGGSAGLSSSAAASVYEAASTLAAQSGLAVAGGFIFESSLTLGASSATEAAASIAMEASATLAAQSGVAADSLAILEAAAIIAASQGHTAAVEAIYEAAATVAAQSGLAAAGEIAGGAIEESLTFAVASGIASAAAESVYEASATLAAQSGVSASSLAILESAATIAAAQGHVAAAEAIYEASAALAAQSGLSAAHLATLEAAAAIASVQGHAAAADAIHEAAATIAAQSGVSAALSGSTFEAATTFAAASGVAAAVQSVLESGASFGGASAIATSSTVGIALKITAAITDAAATGASGSDSAAAGSSGSDSAATGASASDE